MTEEIKQYAHEYAEKQIKHKMAVHDIFNKEQATEEIEQAFIEGADFMYYSNNEELKKQLTEKDKQNEELKDHLSEEVELHSHAEDYIKSLEAQIEKMRNCDNCKYFSTTVCVDCREKEDKQNWKLKE